MQNETTLTCKNCDEVITGRYCSACGQSAETERISWHSIIHEIEHGIIHVDKGILYTIKELVLRPGATIKNYLAGKRVDHFKPFAFIFILSTIYAVLAQATHIGTFFDDVSINTEDPEDQFLIQAIEWARSHFAYTVIFLLPMTSLTTYWIYRKSHYNYFEHLVINAYTSGVRTLLHIAFIPLFMLIQSADTESKLSNVKFGLGVFIHAYFYYEVFDQLPTRSRILKALTSYILSIVVMLTVVVTVTLIIMVFKEM